MQLGNFLGSRKARQSMAAIVALGVVQIPLVSLADAPAPWVQKADQKKKKKKKAARRTARRPVQETQTVTRAPEVPAETVYSPPVETPPPVVEAPPVVVEAPPVYTPPPASVPAPVVASSGGGFNWLFPVLGLIGLGGLVAALGSDSNG